MRKRPQILFSGPFPGPVSGQTVMTAFLFELVNNNCPELEVKLLNTARGTTPFWFLNMMIKLWRMFSVFVKFLAPSEVVCIYLSLGANKGMTYTLLHLAAARLRRSPIVIHHHTYSHIRETSQVMKLIAHLSNKDTMHLCICELMASELKARYPNIKNTLALSNIVSIEKNTYSKGNSSRIRLGHMSNLSFEKGLRETVDLLASLLDKGVDVELTLAGPASSDAVARFLKNTQNVFGTRVNVLGPIYGDHKREFYENIDIFVFPTRYRNETQGIVILEALASQVPILAHSQCCIESDIGPLPGWTIPDDQDFVQVAGSFVMSLLAEDILFNLSELACQRFDLLKDESIEQLNAFLSICRGEVDLEDAGA